MGTLHGLEAKSDVARCVSRADAQCVAMVFVAPSLDTVWRTPSGRDDAVVEDGNAVVQAQ